MKRIICLAIVVATAMQPALSQFFSLSDTTIIFKNQEGKVLAKEEVQELMKSVFSIKQEVANGKKTIAIIPSGSDERVLLNSRMEPFKNSLLNKSIKAFHFADINNKIWDSNEVKGKVLVMNFWFTACKPCILEMPYLNELVKQNQENPVVFIAPAPENDAYVKKFLKEFTFAYNIIPSSLDYITSLNIENFPTHLILDKERIIRQVFIGYADDIKEKLQTEIDKLLK